MTTTLEFPALKEALGKLEAKQRELHVIFDEAGPELDFGKIKSISGDTRTKAARVRELNNEMTGLSKEVDDLKAVGASAEKARMSPASSHRESGSGSGDTGGGYSTGGQTKSFGEHFTASVAYKGRQGQQGPLSTLDVELKTLMTTTTGFDPEETRTGRLVEFATRPIQVTDLIPSTTTTQGAVKYMEETTFTNTAAETAEGNQYPEAALAYTEKTSIVRKIPVFLPVTDEQLEDEPQVRGLIDNRLRFMVRQRLDGQILNGNGVGVNLVGILATPNIQTQAKGGDPTPDAVYKAMVKVRVTGRAMPNATVFHPNDWQDIRLLRTADGIYIWGNPSDAGPERIWGLRVVQSDALPENTGLVGDFANHSELAVRRGVDVQVSNSHGTYFVEGKLAIRADMRVALVIYRPAAFSTVTGI